MKRNEIPVFIDCMDDYGDKWTPEEVERVYGDSTLKDAINDRMSLVNMHLRNIAIAVQHVSENTTK